MGPKHGTIAKSGGIGAVTDLFFDKPTSRTGKAASEAFKILADLLEGGGPKQSGGSHHLGGGAALANAQKGAPAPTMGGTPAATTGAAGGHPAPSMLDSQVSVIQNALESAPQIEGSSYSTSHPNHQQEAKPQIER